MDTNPRWSGVGKGDSSRVRNKVRFQSNRDSIFGKKRKRKHVVKSYKKDGEWLHDVSTPDGIKTMTDQEHDNYEAGL